MSQLRLAIRETDKPLPLDQHRSDISKAVVIVGRKPRKLAYGISQDGPVTLGCDQACFGRRNYYPVGAHQFYSPLASARWVEAVTVWSLKHRSRSTFFRLACRQAFSSVPISALPISASPFIGSSLFSLFLFLS